MAYTVKDILKKCDNITKNGGCKGSRWNCKKGKTVCCYLCGEPCSECEVLGKEGE